METTLSFLSPQQESMRQKQIWLIKMQSLQNVSYTQVKHFRKFYCFASVYYILLFLVFGKVFWTDQSDVNLAMASQQSIDNLEGVSRFIQLGINNLGVHVVLYLTLVCNVNQANFKTFSIITYIFFSIKIAITIYGSKILFGKNGFLNKQAQVNSKLELWLISFYLFIGPIETIL